MERRGIVHTNSPVIKPITLTDMAKFANYFCGVIFAVKPPPGAIFMVKLSSLVTDLLTFL